MAKPGEATDDELRRLAGLLASRDAIDEQIATIVGRSARSGDVGEFIAARILDIKLAPTATQAGYDGVFRAGPLAGKTVNVKNYGDIRAGLDIPEHPCDYALVLSGPPRDGRAGVRHHPWRLASVYLFELTGLLAVLRQRGVKIGGATSLRTADLAAARIFPPSDTAPLRLSEAQRVLLELFAGEAIKQVTRVSVIFSWAEPAGLVAREAGRRLAFPTMPVDPAVYRLAFQYPDDTDDHMYIGEAGDLRGRMNDYRHPGLLGKTRRRIHDLIHDCLGRGGSVQVSILNEPAVMCDGIPIALDLDRKSHRVLVESAVLAALRHAGIAVYNLEQRATGRRRSMGQRTGLP